MIRYTVIPKAELTDTLLAAIGRNPTFGNIRLSVDGEKAIVKFLVKDSPLFTQYPKYTEDEARALMQTPEWTALEHSSVWSKWFSFLR